VVAVIRGSDGDCIRYLFTIKSRHVNVSGIAQRTCCGTVLVCQALLNVPAVELC
jgi:hypothetical protein